jgi:uncharacterized protein YjiS (DUF1127 family)
MTVAVGAADAVSVSRHLMPIVVRPFELVRTWHERARGRRELAMLDRRARRDLGLTDVDVWREANKPFWRA